MSDSGWRVRFTPRGTVHMVKQQDRPHSCGSACALMINYKVKKGVILAGAAGVAGLMVSPIYGSFLGAELMEAAVRDAVRSEQEVYDIYGRVTGNRYDGDIDMEAARMPEVLRQLNLGLWENIATSPRDSGDRLAEAMERGGPVIVGVTWANDGANHAVVVDDVATRGDRRTFYVCDPGTGDVHPTEAGRTSGVPYRGAGWFNGWICARRG